MCGILSPNSVSFDTVIFLRDVQHANAKASISSTLSGIFISSRDSQFEKAPLPILFTLFGIVTFLSLEHPAKNELGISVIFLGNLTYS